MLEELFAGPLGPIIIFGLRIVDVSLATVRMLLSVRGHRASVTAIGFVEVTIWVVAVGVAIQNLHSVWHVLGYSGGFAAGTLAGLWMEEKLAVGLATVHIVSRGEEEGIAVALALRDEGFGVTQLKGEGRSGPVQVLYSTVQRRQIPRVIHTVDRVDPDAFISVEEPRGVHRGWLFSQRRK